MQNLTSRKKFSALSTVYNNHQKILNFKNLLFLFLMNVENYTMERWPSFSKVLSISFTVSRSFG